MADREKRLTPACSLDRYHLTVDDRGIRATVFWARVVSSENESLLTGYTKHTFFELQYALEGRIVITVGENTRHTLDESDFIVIPPDTYHQIVDGDDTGARFIMAFSLETQDPALLSTLRYAGAAPHRESAQLRTLLSLILAKEHEQTALTEKSLSCLIEALLLELLEILTPPHAGQPGGTEKLSESAKRVQTVQDFIKSYHGVGVSVAGLARRFGIGERHLNRIFRAETGNTVRDEINHEKLRYIEELIASTALSLGEISALCDFSDEYAMNKFFKRYNKMRLSDYRRTARHET